MRRFHARGHQRTVGMLLGLSAGLTWTLLAGAQPNPNQNPPAPAQTTTVPPPPAAPTELVEVTANGVTAETVGVRAAQTSYSAKQAMENLRGAAARVDQAWSAFLPRLTATASYTRLSDFAPPSFGTGNIVGTLAPAGTINPNPTIAAALVIPLVLDNYLLQARITVPISDYFLRLDQSYTQQTRSQDAYRYDAISAKATAASNGKVSFYTWIRARGAVVVAEQALNDQRTHLKDVRNQFQVGYATRADILRGDTQVASAELALERAKNLSDLTEAQVRVAMHAPDEERLAPGEGLEPPPAPLQGNLKQFTVEAMSSRYEIKSIDANASAARQSVAYTKAGRYPQISAFADGIYANPNPRRFPQTNEWFPTWDVGAQLVWSPNDVILAGGQVTDAESRVTALEAQRGTIRDGIEIEVLQAYQAVKEADFAIGSSRRELESATEAYRVARELFYYQKSNATTLTDAETDLTRARLDLLNALADARIARVRLDHALGRDIRPFARGAP